MNRGRLTAAAASVRRRLRDEEGGFTLIEMLLALVIMGILLSIAVPSYLTFKDRANRAAATADIRDVIPDILAYAADNVPGGTNDPDPGNTTDSGYTGLTFSILSQTYDPSIDASKYFWDNSYTPSDASSDYCVYTYVGRWYAAKQGPNAPITTGTNMTLNTCTAS